MRKLKILVAFFVMMLMLTNSNTNIVKADGDNYNYRAVTENEETRKVWFKNGEEIDGNPGTMEQMSNVTIEVTPDDSCAAYLASFDEPTVRVRVNPGVEVTFGSEEKAASIQWLTCDNATVTVYAKGGDFAQNGSLEGSVYGVTTYNSNITFRGNIQYLCLGDEFTYDSNITNAGNVSITGNVYSLEWYITGEYNDGTQGTVYYRGFKGNASISGKVGTLTIREIKHSNILDADLKADIGVGSSITGFEMKDGVLSSETNEKVEEIITDMEQFYYELCPQNYGWSKVARYPGGGETGVSKAMTEDEAEERLSTGTARVGVYSSGVSVDLGAYNLAELKFERGTASAGSVTKTDGTGLLQITSYGKETIDVDVAGDVDRFSISFTRYNPNMDINVNGKIKEGHIYKGSLQSDFPIDLGTFSCEGMWIMQDGIWNPALFLSLGKAEYHPVDDIKLEQLLNLAKEYTDQVTGEIISEMADMIVTEMQPGTLENLETDEMFQSAVEGYKDAHVLTGVEIELSKYKYNETTGKVTDQQEVTEIEKDMDFTVKIPGGHKEGKKYIIVREHENKDGSKSMEVLEPEQNGDKLTFKTKKFSSFTIVETAPDEIQETEGIGIVKTAKLKLEDSIAIIYEGAVLKSELGVGEEPTARFTYRGAVSTASGTYMGDLVRESDGKTYAIYQFECRDILPQFADENVKFELLLNDEVIACFEEYSVKAYCTNMLSKTAEALGYSDTKTDYFRKLLVNMLYYADAVKSYQGMSPTLASDLIDEQKKYHTSGAIQNATDKTYVTGDKTEPYQFNEVTLVLADKVNVQIAFTAESTENLSLKIEFDNSVTEYTADDFDYDSSTGRYTVRFDKINATQYDTPLTACFYANGVKQTRELTYSVSSYISKMQNVSESVKSVLTEMYEFGQAAKDYVNAE